jgi:hypothetical protein
MDYLFMALAVFWVIRLLQIWISAPSWLWIIAQLVLSFLSMLPWNGYSWYAPDAVAAIVSFLQMVENFLIAKADESLTAIMKRR